MGGGIAQVAAIAGFPIVVRDVSEPSCGAGRRRSAITRSTSWSTRTSSTPAPARLRSRGSAGPASSRRSPTAGW